MFVFKENLENNFLYSFPESCETKKFAIFDMDHTLIAPKNNKVYPKDENDYEYTYENVIETLEKYINNNYFIYVVSNQYGLLRKEEKKKVEKENIIKKINLAFGMIERSKIGFFLGCDKNYYRKPHTGSYHFIEEYYKIKINKNVSFFCGDALGRKDDFSASDYYYALNCGIMCYSPEELFKKNGEKEYYKKINRAYLEKITSEVSKVELQKIFEILHKDTNKKVILMTGSPASGKTTFSELLSAFDSTYVVLSSDELKTKLDKKYRTHILKKDNIIVDATNPSKKVREKYINEAQSNDYVIYSIYVPFDEEIIHHMNHYRIERSEGKMEALPEIAIRVYKSKYEKPVKEEGFEKVFEYTPYFTFKTKKDETNFFKYY